MKSLSVSRDEFDNIVYPLVAITPAKGGSSELLQVMKILDKFEKRSSPDTDAIVDAAVGTPTLYKLNDDRAKFRLEDAEAEIVKARLEDGIKSLAPMRARVIIPMIAQLGEDIPEPEAETDISPESDS